MNDREPIARSPERSEAPAERGSARRVRNDAGRLNAGRPNRHDFWRSLEELSATPAFEESLHREFPDQASELTDPVGRREFLKLMSASLALAGVTACTKQPPEKIVPYVRQPEELVPGRPVFFATAMPLGGGATGLLVESHMGRPTKVEGNPDHPASLGATDALAQASVLGLYDPDRAQTLTYRGQIRPWSAFLGAMRGALEAKKASGGAGLCFLTESLTSPTLAGQVRDLMRRYPNAPWFQWEAVSRDNVRNGARLAFGELVDPISHVDRADVIVALDADFLSCGSAHVRYAREFAARRKPESGRMNRLYAVESMLSPTGARADHRLPMRATDVERFARDLAARVAPGFSPASAGGPEGPRHNLSPATTRFLDAVATDLQSHRGAGLVMAGNDQPPVVHALAHAMNAALGNAGKTVEYIEPVEAQPVDQLESLGALVSEIDAGQVDLLVILGGNPVFTAPADLKLGEKLAKVQMRVYLGLYHDETAALCHWHIPETHYLETWSDARAFDGTASIVQPLIAPLYGGKSAHEVLAAFTDRPERSSYDLVREHWLTAFSTGPHAEPAASPKPDPAFEKFWKKALHDGIIPNTAAALKTVTVRPFSLPPRAPQGSDSLEIVFRPDPALYDGRFANNAWLQELPKPITKIVWDNAALMSARTAERLGVGNEELIALRLQGRGVQAPVWIVPGHADESVTVHVGYGRMRSGRVGTGAGFNAYAIRSSSAREQAIGLQVERTDEGYPLAVTSRHHAMEGRNHVRAGTLADYARTPAFAREHEQEPPRTLTLYPHHEYTGYAWGMAIDINACVGCNACVVACTAENNVPVVGKDQVIRSREMHWLRVDTYHRGSVDNPQTYFQPLPCMQCENAPCEVVCPVAATVHSDEGLNDMVYNRCIGTRYCSNNCPYKVRRFNFLLYQDWTTPSLKLARNPDVTVRSRGVMEKCTYCVQRINAAKIDAEREGRAVRDGEIATACEAACPAQAIVFGNINDPKSRVAKLKAEERNYSLLAELNTRPRTTYLAAVGNPNPALEPAQTE